MSEYKLVPTEPTDEMKRAGNAELSQHWGAGDAYRAMLAAAPAVSAQLVGYMKVGDIKLINTCEHETAQIFSRPHGNVTIPVYLHPPAPAVAWQDISTAPKDGTEVLICGSDVYGDMWMAVAGYFNDDWREDPGDDAYWFPTHWMPLPTQPNVGV